VNDKDENQIDMGRDGSLLSLQCKGHQVLQLDGATVPRARVRGKVSGHLRLTLPICKRFANNSTVGRASIVRRVSRDLFFNRGRQFVAGQR